ncbi:phosphotransferase family protein [Lapillicoccus sp.]|uniref:phosphotransferase family protein n=1 Tax=Lapillicoccus sp. TaxID=1909287 RepID=UPI0039834E92
MTATQPPGLDLVALETWLADAAPGLLTGPLTGEVIAGGKSNLTYVVTDGTGSVIVRRPPLGHVLATAHDMVREHRVMAALLKTAVPVPEMYAVCADAAVIGAPFYVMELVDGIPYRAVEELEALGAERTRAIGERMVDTLADLHDVVPASVGLADFGRPQGFLARQVRRWGAQRASSRSRDLVGADELERLLREGLPQESAPAIVHGDYRLDNLLVNPGDEIGAVVDWEMATLGDPLTDVALLLTYHRIADLELGAGVSTASRAPGFVSRDDVVARYGARSDRDLTHLGFYEALACFKLAVILEGIHYRHVHGQTVGEGFSQIGAMVEPLLALGLDSMKEH